MKCLCVPVRTDCCFSPDDKLLVTGTSVKKEEGNGTLAFFDRTSFQKVHEIEVTDAVSFFFSWFGTCLLLIFFSGSATLAWYGEKSRSKESGLKRKVSKVKGKQAESGVMWPFVIPTKLWQRSFWMFICTAFEAQLKFNYRHVPSTSTGRECTVKYVSIRCTFWARVSKNLCDEGSQP